MQDKKTDARNTAFLSLRMSLDRYYIITIRIFLYDHIHHEHRPNFIHYRRQSHITSRIEAHVLSTLK